MTQYLSGNETVRHESLLDQIKVRAAFQTPMLARFPHESTDHVTPEWPIDVPFASTDSVRDISAPHADARLEGSAYSFEGTSFELRMKAVCEIKHHGIEMSGTARSGNIAGQESPWDYRVGKVFTKHLNSIDNTGMYGVGMPETAGGTATTGATTAGTARRMQGLIFNSAWTGLQRQHGASGISSIMDPYGTTIPSDYWSVFTDFEHSAITMESFYNNLVAPALTAGADMETSPWMFQCGYRVMQRVARFLIADGGIPINERQRNADDAMGNDYLNMFRLASGTVVTFRTNRWLNETDDTFSVNNQTDALLTPYSPDPAGDQSRTLYGDQTLIGHEPGCVKWKWFREPGFQIVETNGDYDQLAVVSEMTLMVDHPLCVMGAANVLS